METIPEKLIWVFMFKKYFEKIKKKLFILF